jgi:toxin secretion/phage lysis holin
MTMDGHGAIFWAFKEATRIESSLIAKAQTVIQKDLPIPVVGDVLKGLINVIDHLGLKAVFVVCISFLEYLIGSIHAPALHVVCVMIGMDLFSGILKGIKTGHLKSEKMKEGLWKILGYFILITIGHQSGKMNLQFNLFGLANTLIFSHIFVQESISILENIVVINKNLLPPFLARYIKAEKKIKEMGLEKAIIDKLCAVCKRVDCEHKNKGAAYCPLLDEEKEDVSDSSGTD